MWSRSMSPLLQQLFALSSVGKRDEPADLQAFVHQQCATIPLGVRQFGRQGIMIGNTRVDEFDDVLPVFFSIGEDDARGCNAPRGMFTYDVFGHK